MQHFSVSVAPCTENFHWTWFFNTYQQTRRLISTWKTSNKQQQRLESPTLTLTWHASKYKVHNLHQRYVLKNLCPQAAYTPSTSGTLSDTSVYRHKREPNFYSRPYTVIWSWNWLNINYTNTHMYMLTSEWIAPILNITRPRAPAQYKYSAQVLRDSYFNT